MNRNIISKWLKLDRPKYEAKANKRKINVWFKRIQTFLVGLRL